MNTDGSGREIYTYGVRNSVGHDFNPGKRRVCGLPDNQVDGMGDDQPPGEINRQTAMGQHFRVTRGTAAVRSGRTSTWTTPPRTAS